MWKITRMMPRRLARSCASTCSPSSPAWSTAFCSESLLGKARGTGLLDLRLHDLREHTTDVHRTVDDAPFGGGAGMVMQARADLRLGRGRATAAPVVPARARVAAASTRRWPTSCAAARRASACSAAATRASTTGCASTWSTAS